MYCQYVVDRTAGHTLEDYLESLDFSLAVEKALINVGIAAWSIRENEPDIYDEMPALQEAIALRNRLAHGYGEVINDDLVWRAATISIPELLTEVQEKLLDL